MMLSQLREVTAFPISLFFVCVESMGEEVFYALGTPKCLFSGGFKIHIHDQDALEARVYFIVGVV
tara:strand:- start:13804 stop:13998 length:195 start_codon:yes stop_codon:yes gene_type:complete